MLTTLALLIVAMGLMVSLARYVRAQSAQQYTRRLLAELDLAQQQYGGAPPPLDDLAGDAGADHRLSAAPEEAEAAEYVNRVNGPYIAALLQRLHPGEQRTAVRDAWGNPVGYLPSQNPRIGMAPQNQPFFFSAGPDGRFLTRQDNLYSYEQIKPGALPDLPLPLPTAPAQSPSLDTANNYPTTAPMRSSAAGGTAMQKTAHGTIGP